MEQNGTNWIPSAEQVKLADMMINPEDRRTKREKFEEAGVPITTAYRWFKDKNYVEYIKSRLEEVKNSELPDIWKSLILQCKRGNINAIKLYFELNGDYSQKQQIDIGNKDGKPFEVSILSAEERKSRINELISKMQEE
jgi:hypothetical protein